MSQAQPYPITDQDLQEMIQDNVRRAEEKRAEAKLFYEKYLYAGEEYGQAHKNAAHHAFEASNTFAARADQFRQNLQDRQEGRAAPEPARFEKSKEALDRHHAQQAQMEQAEEVQGRGRGIGPTSDRYQILRDEHAKAMKEADEMTRAEQQVKSKGR